MKIGHTISADIRMLKKNLDLDLAKKGFLNNYVEIPSVFKALKPEDRLSGLAHIAETILSRILFFLFT